MATEAQTAEPVALLERGANSQLSPAEFNQPTEIADYLVKSENVKTSTDVLVESGINGNARPLEGEGFVESSTVANVVGEQTYHAREKVDAVEETGTNDNEVTDRSKEIEGKGITNNEFGHVKNECADVVENELVLVAEKQTDGSKQNEEEGKETDKSDEQETIREVSSFLEASLGQTKEAVIHTAEHKLSDSDDSVETITDCIENESKDAVTSTVTEITQESTGDRSLGMAISINQNDSREVEVIENKIDQPSVLLSTVGDQLELTPSVACKEEHKETEIPDKTGEADDSESGKGREEKNPEKKLDDLVSNHEEGKQSVGEEQILSEASAGEGRGEDVHTIIVAEDSITEVACPEEMPGPKENLMQKHEPENEKIESSQKVSKETEMAASNEIKNQEDYFDEEAKAEKSNETNVISDTGIPNEEISPPTTLDEKAQGADVEIENKNADDWHPNRSLEQEITLPEGEKLEKSSDFKHQELVDEESGVSTREETTPKLVSQTTEAEDEKLKDVSDSKDNLDIKDAGKNMEECDPQMEISAASSNDTESKGEEKSVSNDNIVEQTFEPENIQEAETTLQAEVGEDVKEKIPEENVKSNSQESVGEDKTKDLQSDEKITGQSSTENFEGHETARTINNAVKEKNQIDGITNLTEQECLQSENPTLAIEPITNVKEATDKEDPGEDIKEKDQSTEVSEEIASKDIIEVQEIIQTAAEAEDKDKQDSIVEDKIEVIAREMHEDPLQKEKEDDLDITDLKEEIKDSKTEFTEPVEERGYVEERESETLKDNEEPNSELTPAKASEETMLQKEVNESLAKIPTLDEESKEETFEKEKHDIDESNNASTATKETKHEEGESEDKVEMENSTLARGKEPVEMGMESDKLHQMDVVAESENDTNLDESRDPEIAVVENEVEEQIEHGIQKEAPIAGTEDQTNATASETPSAHMSDDILKECSTMPSQESDLVTSEASDILDENAEEKSKSSLTEVVAEEKARAEVEAGTDNKELEAADTENTEILTQQECAPKTMTEESQEIIRDTNQSELGEKMTNFQNESSEFVEQKSQEEGHHETQEKEEPKEPRDHVKETQNADEIVKAVILTEEVQDVEEADGEDKTVKLANEEKEGIKESHTELTEGESGEKAEESMSTEQPKELDSNEQGETVNSDVQEDSVMEKEILITKQTEEALEQDEADEKSSSTAAVQESEEMKKEITEEAYSSHDKIKEITTSETSLDETQIDEKPAQASNTTEDESSLGTVEVEASQQGDVVNSIAVEENSSNLASQHLAENNENATEEQIEDADADEVEERKKASDVDVVHQSVDHYVEASQPSLEFNEDKKDESQDETDERKEAPEVISEASLQTLPVQRFDEQNKTSSELLSEEQEDGISALMDVVAEEEISSDQTLLTETLKEHNQTKKTKEVSLHMELPEEHGIQKESPKEVREDEDCGESKEDIKEVAGLSSRPDFQNFKAPKEDEIASDTTLVTEEKSEEKSQTPSDAMIDETPAISDRIEQHMQEEENIEKNACFSTQGTKEVEALEVEIEKDNVNEVSNKDGGTPEEVLKLQPHENPSEDVESEKITSAEVQSYEKTMESEESEVKEKHLVAAIPDFVQTNQPKETVDATDVAGNEITNEEIADKKEEWESISPVTLNEETAKESSQLHELTAEERLGDDMIEKEIQNKKVDEEVERADDSETIEKEIVEARIAEPLDQAGVKKEINNDSFTEAEEGGNDKEDQIERDPEKQDDQTVVGQGSRAEALTVTEKESGAEISDVKESVGDVEISSDENLPIAKSGEPSEIPSAREKTEGATSTINEYVEVTTKEVEVAEDVSSRTESVSLPKEGDRKLEICHSKCPLDAEEQKEAPKEVHEEEDIAPAETREEIKKEVDCESVSNSGSQGLESTKEEIISGETLATGKKLEEKSQTPSADLVSEITTLLEKAEDRAKPDDTQGDNKLQTKEREFQGLALEKESKEAGEVPDEAFKLESQENGTEIKDTECPTKNEEIEGLSKETSDLETNISEETSKSKSEICSSEVKDTQREEAITNDTNELMLKEVINDGIKEDKDDTKGTPLMVGSEVTTKECHQKPEGKPEESLEDQKTMEEPQIEAEVGTEISNAKEAVEDGTFTTDKSLPVAEFDEIQSVALLSEEQKHGASGTTDCIKEGMKGVEGTEQPKTMEEVPLQKEESSELGVSQVETQVDKYVLETPKEVHEGEATTKEMEVSGDVPIVMEEPTGPEISESKRPLDADVQMDSQKESAPIETKEESKEEEDSTEISDAEEAVEEDKITSDKSLLDSKLEEEKEIQSVAMLSEEQKHGTSETTECIKEVTEEVEGTEDEPKTAEEVPLQKEEPGELGLSQLETHPEKYIEETPKEVHEGEATAKEVEMMGDVPNIIEEASLQKEEPRGGEISESKQLLDADAQMDSQKEVHKEEDKALIETEEIKEEEVGADISESKEAVEDDKNIRDKSLPVAKLEEQNEIQSVALVSEEQKQGTSATTHCIKEVTKGVEGTEVEPKTMEKVPLQKEEPRELEVFQVETQLDKYVQETLKEVHEGEATMKEVEVIGDIPNIMEEASLQKEEPEESEISESYRLLDADVKMDSQNEVHAEENSAPIETKEEVESKAVSNSDSQLSEAPKEDKITSAEALTTEEKSEEQSRMPFAALVSETTPPSEKEEQEKAVETPEDDNMKVSATPHDLQAQGLVLDKDQSLEEEKTINEAVKLASEEKKPNIKDEKCLHESERVTKIVGLPEGTSNIKNEISEETLVSESEIHSNEVITEPGKTETKEEQAEEAIATKIVDNEVTNEEVAEHKDALPMTVTEVTTKECHQEPQPNLDESLENKTTEELQTKEDFGTEISGAKKEIVEEKVTSDKGLLMAKSDRKIQIQSAALRLEEQTQGASATIESRKEASEDIEGIIDEPKTTEEVPLQKEAHSEFEGSKLEMESPKEVQEEESEATGKTKEETKGAPETPLKFDSNEIEDKSDSNSQEISAALASETTTILEKIEDPKREVETPGNENPQISKEESKETEAGKLPEEASKLENQENKSKTKHAECPLQPETTSNLKAEQTSKLDSEIHSYEVVPKPVETEIIKKLLPQEKNDLQQNTIDTVKVQQIKVTDEQVTESKQGTNKECQQKYELKPENNTAAKDIQNEKVEKSQEEGKTANAASGDEKTSEAEERGIAEDKFSLQDMLEKPTREWHHAAEETEEAKKVKSGGEEEDEEEEQKKHDSSGSDAPVMVEACREMEIKSPHKKSLLSGVGSKVKHSISKVKKAITGSGGGGKSSSQAKQQHSPK